MKRGFYWALAWTGIKKNQKLYLPYILTCMGMVMICYIISFLSISPTFNNIKGGNTMQSFLGIGFGVMSSFSLIFLFYVNSFLIRRRKKEFGLYNILGLGKKNLAWVLVSETIMIVFITIVGGLFFGILFSKLAELCMVKMLGGNATFHFDIMIESVYQTIILFAIIFILIFLNTLRQIHLTNPIELLHSENVGEKPPKVNWVIAILGVVILAAAYYLAVTIQDPVSAIMTFFIAVVMVVVATYLLFIAGSVTLCRILQKNKQYYYKTNHFVSVSSMAYRMKRNGAGLASICILCTMVLVMVSSTVCLYIGKEDSLRHEYPRNINLDIQVSNTQLLNGELAEQTKQITEQVLQNYGVEAENTLKYDTAALGGVIENNQIIYDYSVYEDQMDVISDIWQIFIVPLSDYNRLMGENETLAPGEAMIYTTMEMEYTQSTIQIGNNEPLTITKQVSEFVDNGVDFTQIFPSLYLFVSDFDAVVEPLVDDTSAKDHQQLVTLRRYYGFDLSCDDEMQIKILDEISEQTGEIGIEQGTNEYFSVTLNGVAKDRADFYGLYGGLFFLGILLGMVFIIAAVLIIYYKQVLEGYEDQSRFDIMQKVGMTKKEIKKSINSQILTVFFLPLITAGVHLTFAFPIIQKLLILFGLVNVKLLVIVMVVCYLVFALFYILVYRMTSRSYFSIVSGMKE
jgi:putative ABC transport system permease protein